MLWPLLGLAFEKQDITDFIPNMLNALLTDPGAYVPELVGAAIIFWFCWTLLRKRMVYSFIRYEKPADSFQTKAITEQALMMIGVRHTACSAG